MEAYSQDFLAILNAWDAAVKYYSRRDASEPEDIAALDIADLTGWAHPDKSKTAAKGAARMNETAQTCAAAHELISEGHLERNDLMGISVFTAPRITQRPDVSQSMSRNRVRTDGNPVADRVAHQIVHGRGLCRFKSQVSVLDILHQESLTLQVSLNPFTHGPNEVLQAPPGRRRDSERAIVLIARLQYTSWV